MIYLPTVKRFCKEYWKVENYDQAMADTTRTWHCHHRHEIDWVLPKEELIAIGRYYDVHYSELIFLTPEEHKRLHKIGKEGYWKGKVGPTKGRVSPMKGKHHTEETKQKMGEARQGKNNPNYKHHITKEELYDLYVVQGLSTYKIADLYGCSNRCIWLKLKKYNIKK